MSICKQHQQRQKQKLYLLYLFLHFLGYILKADVFHPDMKVCLMKVPLEEDPPNEQKEKTGYELMDPV